MTQIDRPSILYRRDRRQDALEPARRSLSYLLMNDVMLREKKADFFGEHLRTLAEQSGAIQTDAARLWTLSADMTGINAFG